jgi:hypothetical protein
MIHGLVAFGPRAISYKSTRPAHQGRTHNPEEVNDMTGNSSTAGREAFDKSLLECVEDINKLLPALSRRYDTTVIIGALAEQVGSALKVLMQKKVCNARQALQVIDSIESSAFRDKPAKPKPRGSTPDGDGP